MIEGLVENIERPNRSSLVLIPSDMVGGGFDPDSLWSVRMALAVETPKLAVETPTLAVQTPLEEGVDQGNFLALSCVLSCWNLCQFASACPQASLFAVVQDPILTNDCR